MRGIFRIVVIILLMLALLYVVWIVLCSVNEQFDNSVTTYTESLELFPQKAYLTTYLTSYSEQSQVGTPIYQPSNSKWYCYDGSSYFLINGTVPNSIIAGFPTVGDTLIGPNSYLFDSRVNITNLTVSFYATINSVAFTPSVPTIPLFSLAADSPNYVNIYLTSNINNSSSLYIGFDIAQQTYLWNLPITQATSITPNLYSFVYNSSIGLNGTGALYINSVVQTTPIVTGVYDATKPIIPGSESVKINSAGTWDAKLYAFAYFTTSLSVTDISLLKTYFDTENSGVAKNLYLSEQTAKTNIASQNTIIDTLKQKVHECSSNMFSIINPIDHINWFIKMPGEQFTNIMEHHRYTPMNSSNMNSSNMNSSNIMDYHRYTPMNSSNMNSSNMNSSNIMDYHRYTPMNSSNIMEHHRYTPINYSGRNTNNSSVNPIISSNKYSISYPWEASGATNLTYNIPEYDDNNAVTKGKSVTKINVNYNFQNNPNSSGYNPTPVQTTTPYTPSSPPQLGATNNNYTGYLPPTYSTPENSGFPSNSYDDSIPVGMGNNTPQNSGITNFVTSLFEKHSPKTGLPPLDNYGWVAGQTGAASNTGNNKALYPPADQPNFQVDPVLVEEDDGPFKAYQRGSRVDSKFVDDNLYVSPNNMQQGNISTNPFETSDSMLEQAKPSSIFGSWWIN